MQRNRAKYSLTMGPEPSSEPLEVVECDPYGVTHDFYSDRTNGPTPRVADEVSEAVWNGLAALIYSRLDGQWLAHSFPIECADGNGIVDTNRGAFIDLLLGAGARRAVATDWQRRSGRPGGLRRRGVRSESGGEARAGSLARLPEAPRTYVRLPSRGPSVPARGQSTPGA